jgi:molybdenum cofactor biosynthesis enzyme MoaA
MPLTAFGALLRQLKAEGVERIGIVHFEGRGDPLVNPELGKMVELTRALYPVATTMVTTHGSYRYKDWIVEGALDILRVSIDGSFPENYAKYRVGGDFNLVMKFLQTLQSERLRLRVDFPLSGSTFFLSGTTRTKRSGMPPCWRMNSIQPWNFA